jgi:hypothetical protein
MEKKDEVLVLESVGENSHNLSWNPTINLLDVKNDEPHLVTIAI